MDRLQGGGAAALPRAGRLRLRHPPVRARRRHQRAQRAPDRHRGELDEGDAGQFWKSGEPARRLRAAAQQRDAFSPRREPVHVLRRALRLEPALARPRATVLPGRQGRLEQCRRRLPPLQQPQGLAHAGTGGHAAARGAIHADVCRVHLPEGPARARRPDGIPARALPAHEPAARANPAIPVVTPAGPPAIHLIDASYFVFRAYYSVGLEMTDGDGQPVNALYGFGRFLGDLLEEAKPEHVAVAFDESLTTSFRNSIYPAYKKNREPAPPELRRQFGLCRELCRLLGLAEFGSPTHEADDIIGTIAARLRATGHLSVLVTRDKDLAQLVRDGDHYWDYAGARRFAYHEIEAQFGVRPERMADYQALMGDSVDNIPGIPGIGPKTAAALLQVFSSLEELYEGLDRVGALPIRGAARSEEHTSELQSPCNLVCRLLL